MSDTFGDFMIGNATKADKRIRELESEVSTLSRRLQLAKEALGWIAIHEQYADDPAVKSRAREALKAIEANREER